MLVCQEVAVGRFEVTQDDVLVGRIVVVMDDCVVHDHAGRFVGTYLDEERALKELVNHIENSNAE